MVADTINLSCFVFVLLLLMEDGGYFSCYRCCYVQCMLSPRLLVKTFSLNRSFLRTKVFLLHVRR